MSTDYTLYSNGPVELFATERSGAIEIGLIREDLPDHRNYLDTAIGLTSEEVLDVVVRLIKCASYVSEEPEEIVQELLKKIWKDAYLGTMLYDLRG